MPDKSLEEAIDKAINLGQKDPIEIVKKIRKQNGDEWFVDQAALVHADVELDAQLRREEAADGS